MPLPICALPRSVALVALDPGAGFHVALAHHGAGQHGGVHLVASAVQEAGVDERHAAGGRGNAGLEVHRRAAFLVHDAELHCALGQAEQLLHAAKQFGGKRHLGRAVHLGLDDVDRAFARVADGVFLRALEVVQGDGGGDHRVHDAFGNFLAFSAPEDGRVGHEVAHVAKEHERTAVQTDLAFAIGGGVFAVGVEPAREGGAAFAHRLGQRGLQDAEPVAVGQHLVFSVHRGDGIFQVEDGGERGLQHKIAHAGGVGLADGRVAVDLDVQVQAVVLEQHRAGRLGLALVTHQLRLVGQLAGATFGQAHHELTVLVDLVAGGAHV